MPVPAPDLLATLHDMLSAFLQALDSANEDAGRAAATVVHAQLLLITPLPDPADVSGWPDDLRLPKAITELRQLVAKLAPPTDVLADPGNQREWIAGARKHVPQLRTIDETLVRCLKWYGEDLDDGEGEEAEVPPPNSMAVHTIGDLLKAHTAATSTKDTMEFHRNADRLAYERFFQIVLPKYVHFDEKMAIRAAIVEVCQKCNMEQWQVLRLSLPEFLLKYEGVRDRDGPGQVREFFWRGKRYELPPTPWKILAYVWNQEGQRATFADVGERVFDDPYASSNRIQRHLTTINNALMETGIQLHGRNEVVTIELPSV
jgi:hypothetical protein